jgi:hypothetical protein
MFDYFRAELVPTVEEFDEMPDAPFGAETEVDSVPTGDAEDGEVCGITPEEPGG